MKLRLQVLGGVSLTRGDSLIVGGAAQRRNLALLAVLAVHAERGITREKVAALLWPDADEASARNNLKQALHVLRRDLGAEAVGGTTVLQLSADVVAADVVEFERAAARGDLEAAVEAYGGPLLDGFHAGDPADEFEPWVDSHRARLARLHREALESLASRATSALDHRMALRWWRRLADLDPLDGVSAAGVITALIRSGDYAGAQREYEAHSALLAREGIPPSSVVERSLAEPGPAAPDLIAPRPASAPAVELIPSRPTHRRRVPAAAIGGGIATIALILTLAAIAATRHPDPNRLVIGTLAGADAATTARVHQIANTIAGRLSAAGIATPSAIEIRPEHRETDAARSGAGLALVVFGHTEPDGFVCEATLIDTHSSARLWSGRASGIDCSSSQTLTERAAAAAAARLDWRMRNWINVASGPATIDSYMDFRDGLDMYGAIQKTDAEERFRRAAARDPGFTMARIMTAWASHYVHNGQDDAQALAISDSVSKLELPPLDRAMVEHQAAVFQHDYVRAYQKAVHVVAVAPDAEWRYLLAESALDVGRGREAVRVLANLDPETGWLRGRATVYWVAYVRSLHFVGDHARELDVMKRAEKQLPANTVFQLTIAALAAAGRLKDVEREIDRSEAAGGANDPGFLALERAFIEFRAHGYSKEAAQISIKGLSYMDRLPPALQKEGMLLRVDLLVGAGRLADARRQADTAAGFDVSDTLWNLATRSVLAADLRDTVAARQIADSVQHWIGADSDPDVLMNRARIAVGLGDREEAIRLIRASYSRGYAWRFDTHWTWPFERLRGWAPYDALAGPID